MRLPRPKHLAACTLLAWALALAGAGVAVAEPSESYALWDTFARVVREIRLRFVEPVSYSSLLYAGIRGMVTSLDPHSAFLDPPAYRALKDEERGRHHGIGIELEPSPEGPRIGAMVEGGPGDKAGLRSGDLVQAIGGRPAASIPREEWPGLLRRLDTTPVVLSVSRDGQVADYTLVPDWLHTPAVWGELLAPGLGHIVLATFQQGTAAEFRAALSQLEQAGGPLRGLVLDVRDNPGGLIEEAAAIVDVFVGDSLIVRTVGRGPGSEESYRGRPSSTDLTSCVVVVLVNGSSASASEILAGALRDLKGSPLVGSATFGKGSVQVLSDLEDGSALKLTVSRYILPHGEGVDSLVGLTPDLVVEDQEEAAFRSVLARLDRSIQEEPNLTPTDRSTLQAIVKKTRRHPQVRTRARDTREPLKERLRTDPQLKAAFLLVQERTGQVEGRP